MDHKKVEPVRLAYTLDDGTVIERDYMAEFNDGTFSGNITATTGTFAGTLTASAIDAVGNVNIQGSAVARTFVTRKSHALIRAEKSTWSNVAWLDVDIPYEDQQGGYLSVAVQYHVLARNVGIHHGRMRLTIGGQTAWITPDYLQASTSSVFNTDRQHLLEFLYPVTGPGVWRVSLDMFFQYYRVEFITTGFTYSDIIIRADYLRK